MKRMGRWLFRVTVGGLLLLNISLLIIWLAGRTGTGPGREHHLVGRWFYRLSDSRHVGNVSFRIFHHWPVPNVGPAFGPGRSYTPELLAWYQTLPTGQHYRSDMDVRYWFTLDHDVDFEINSANRMVARGTYLTIGIPYPVIWIMWLPIAVAAWVIWRREVPARRIKRGLCAACGYDLRATPDRCPECGTIPSTASQNLMH